MSRDSVSLHGHAALASLVIVSASCIAINVKAESELEPASLVALSGTSATYLLENFNPKVPVLIASAGEGVVVVEFGGNPLEVFSPGIPLDCVDNGGLMCCATGTLFIGATYQDQLGWVNTGILCVAPRAYDGVDVDSVPDEVSRELAYDPFKVDGCFMLLAEADGTPRVLVNAPSQDSWRWSHCFNHLAELEGASKSLATVTPKSSGVWLGLSDVQRSVLRANSAVSLASHHGRPPPPNVLLYAPPYCNFEGIARYQRCHRNSHHWFIKDGTVSYERWLVSVPCVCP